jgi:N-acyl homoserine lactone hydrolase
MIHRSSRQEILSLKREQIGLVIFGHDQEQWETLKKAPAFYA